MYLAHQPVVDRRVALKVPRPELLLTDSARRRFVRQARVEGTLDHPNLVRVLEAGEAGPILYIASDYIEGPTLRSWLRARTRAIPPELTARLTATIARAVAHAHARGVLHRDLKPSNVLLSLPVWDESQADDPVAESAVRVADFGLARLMDQAGDETRSGVPLGSPSYMAPEQAEGRIADFGPATDVYGIGAILYELLTGQPPFRGESSLDVLRQVVADDPVSPRLLRPGLARDLETIGLTCLAKDPARRYAAAAALADDLERFRDGRPIRARPVGVLERARKWARRRPAAAALAVVLVLAVAGLAAAAAWRGVILRRHNRELTASVDRAEAYSRQVERLLDAARLRDVRQALDAGNPVHAQELFATLTDRGDGRDLRGFAWGWLRRQARREAVLLWTHETNSNAMTLGPDGKTLAVGDSFGTIRIGAIDGSRPPTRLDGHTSLVEDLAFSTDGRLLASSAEDQPAVRLWDVAAGRQIAAVEDPALAPVRRLAFATGDSRLAGCFEQPGVPRVDVRLYDLAGRPPELRLAHRFVAVSLPAFDPTGHLLAIPVADGRLDLFDAATGSLIQTLTGQGGPWLPAFSPDGRRLAVSFSSELVIWGIPEAREVDRFPVGPRSQSPPVLSHDGVVAAALDSEGQVHVLDRERGRTRTIVPDDLARSQRSTNVALSPDGRSLATSVWGMPGGAAPLMVWDLETGRGRTLLGGQPVNRPRLSFVPDGRSVLAAGDHLVLRCRLDPPPNADPAPRIDHGGKWVWSVAVSADGRRIASGGDDARIVLRDIAGAESPVVFEGHTEAVDTLAFSPDGRTLASGSQEPSNHLKLWDLATHRERLNLEGHTDKVRSVAFNRAGTVLASASFDRTARTWDVRSGQPLMTFAGHTDRVHQSVFAPDDRTLATASDDGTVRLWDVASGKSVRVFRQGRSVFSAAFAPDGLTLAAGDALGTVTLREPATGHVLLTIRAKYPAEVRALAFAPDGQLLAGAMADGTVQLWDVPKGQEILVLGEHKAQVNALAFTLDGMTLASGSHDGSLRLWRADTEPEP